MLVGLVFRRMAKNTGSGERKGWALFNLVFSVVFLIVMHGLGGFVKILTIVSLTYALIKALAGTGKFMVNTVWAWCILILFMNHWYQGYQFRLIFPPLAFLVLVTCLR